MNKKFSTLVAGFALLSVTSASAQQKGDTYSELISKLGKISAVDKLKDADNGLYQLSNQNGTSSNADSVLYMDSDTKALKMVPAPISSDSLANTLWCVKITANAAQGQTYKYDFTNKGTGLTLDVTKEGVAGNPANTIVSGQDTARVGGEIAGWAFAPTYATKLTQDNFIYSYFSKDSVIGLAMSHTANAGIFLVKEAADKAIRQDASSIMTKFTLKKAAEIVLKADQINTLFGQQTADKGVKLTFSPDVNKVSQKNPFANADAKFMAEQVNAASGSANSLNYVYVFKSDSSYLKVDTALANGDGVKFLAYGWSDLSKAKRKAYATPQDTLNNSVLKSQYQFLFTYKPSVDSLNIFVNRATFQTKNGVKQSWSANADTIGVSNAHVSIQDLQTSDEIRILTVDSVSQNTHIKFLYSGCTAATSDKTSKDNGLYVIYNAKGQVLASPIHKNGKAYEWITLDEQNPEHMPAYQWLIQKTQNAESLKATSPIQIKNREFSDAATIQLRLKDDKVLADAFGFTGVSVTTGTALNFVQITDSTILKDSYLGYRKFDEDSLTVTKYKFNYLHPYAQDKWIKKGADKDSVLYATDGYTAFSISEGTQIAYGAVAPNVEGLKGIAKLKRNQYLISLKNNLVGVGAESKIVLGQVAKDSVYFKENNHFNGNHYFAIVNAAWDTISTHKFGVADDGMTANLKSQVLAESRTSAFAIKVDDVPLYRRFNNAMLKESAIDAADTLRFIETVRKEYLMDENNREGGLMDKTVNYLGIWTKDKATGLGFHVDTAWVKRDLGYIKPQYLISVNRTVVGSHGGYICEETTGHIKADGTPTDNAEECYHSKPETPGFVHAKFLVSFQDSVAKLGKDKPYTDIKGGYTRVGFVKAIKSNDKLFFLVNGFENMAPKDLDTAKIAKAYKDANIYSTYVKSLKGDEHKNYTWSFRYVHPENAANVAEEGTANSFLIESMAYPENAAGEYLSTGAKKDIAPNVAAWIKMQNGCIVLTDQSSTFGNAKTGGDGALIFNVENKENDELATDNETVTTSEVSVIAGNGAVRIANAEGKKVVISNILGQVIANTVLASSDATIAAPQGVVVVAVEGEEAVKAIVK